MRRMWRPTKVGWFGLRKLRPTTTSDVEFVTLTDRARFKNVAPM